MNLSKNTQYLCDSPDDMKTPKLTKSLFVEFVTDPHVARWHCHDKNVYDQIMEKLYGEMDGLAVGKAVEEQVCHLLQ